MNYLIIDAHAHVTEKEYGNVQNLLKRYEKTGISKGVLVPGGMMDVKKMSQYITGSEKPKEDYIPNFLVETVMNEFPDVFWGFYCVNPNRGLKVCEEFENAVKYRGFSGLKLAPIVHKFSYHSETVINLAKICEDMNLPMYIHSTHLPESNTLSVKELALKCPKTKIILGHMGCGNSDMEAVEAAISCRNLFLETSCSSTLIVKEAIKILGDERVIFGSEYPMDDPQYALTKIQCLDLNLTHFENITCNNILNLLQV